MNKLEKLRDLAYTKSIDIYDYHISDNKKAMCLYNDNCKSIAMDMAAIESSAEEKEILAEEIGHYETNGLYVLDATYNSPIYRSNVIWCEGKSKRWKIKKLLPIDSLEEAINDGYETPYQLAEYFNLTVEFINEAIEFYREKYSFGIFDK